MSRDPRQARILTLRSLRWVIAHRAWSRYHLVRYWRFVRFRMRHPDVVCEGFVFLGKRVEIETRKHHGRIILGRWVHLGGGTRLRAHNGTLRIGDKVVLGSDNTVNCHLDIEIGRATIISDWVYIGDFDHVTSDLTLPIKDQGLVTSPVRIGPECWIGVKSSVLRGTRLGTGCVVAAHAVARGEYEDYAIIGGVPGRVVKSRTAFAEDFAEIRRYEAEVAAEQRDAIEGRTKPED